MKGDQIIVADVVRTIALQIMDLVLPRIKLVDRLYTIGIAGESGSGKTVLAQALSQALAEGRITSIVICQDDYFRLPPRSNDLKRRDDPSWLGPDKEVRLDIMDENLRDARSGLTEIKKPLVDYYANSIEEEALPLDGFKVVIAEGTYVSLLRNIDTRVFIEKTWQQTLENRLARKRGNEAGDPFIEGILVREHQIITRHRELADLIVTAENSVLHRERE
jgi:uridine kinase